MGVTPLVSIIVPIYNVAPYIRKCLDSLKSQTIQEIEVICIDDGSTDDSGNIADEYKNDVWPIFRVIHTENRGLSAARNRGIDNARADWIMFVDSDDWVESSFCEKPYRIAIDTDSDLVIFERILMRENGRVKHEKKSNITTGIIDFETAIDIGWPAVWNKLYKKSLFDDIQFPEGQVYEELSTTHKLIYKAKRISIVSDKLYYYRLRKDGITQTVKNDLAWIEAGEKRANELIDYGYPTEKANAELYRIALKCCGRAEKTNGIVYKKASEIIDRTACITSDFTTRERAMLTLWRISKPFYRITYKMARKCCKT